MHLLLALRALMGDQTHHLGCALTGNWPCTLFGVQDDASAGWATWPKLRFVFFFFKLFYCCSITVVCIPPTTRCVFLKTAHGLDLSSYPRRPTRAETSLSLQVFGQAGKYWAERVFLLPFFLPFFFFWSVTARLNISGKSNSKRSSCSLDKYRL